MALERVWVEKRAPARVCEALDAPVMGEDCSRIGAPDVIAGCAGIPFHRLEVMPINDY